MYSGQKFSRMCEIPGVMDVTAAQREEVSNETEEKRLP